MKLRRVVFVQSVEAPGRSDRVAYLQSNEPERRDCYAPDLWLSPLGVQAGDEIYPLHLVRRMTVDSAAVLEAAPQRERFVEAMSSDGGVPRRPRRAPRADEEKAPSTGK